MIKIAPSILSADFARLADDISRVAPYSDMLHIDVMDGVFVPNITIGPPVVSAIRKATDLPFDVHLMIVRPEEHIEAFRVAGADIITVHAEATYHLHRLLSQIRDMGAGVGVAINPATPVEAIEHVLDIVDMVLVMTVNPGFGGQRMIASALKKVEQVRELANRAEASIDIQVDGGISADTIGEAARAGANVFVAGSYIFGACEAGTGTGAGTGAAEAIANLRRRAAEAAEHAAQTGMIKS